jgi:signal transduction histidine kinase
MLNKRVETSAIDRSGREFPVELTIAPVPWRGTWFFNAFVHDISERRERDALEAASEAKDHFIAVLSHELRTPLTPVLATILDLNTRRDLEPPVQKAIDLIQRNVELEARLIDDLLDVTRMSKRKLRIERRPVSLQA